MSFTPAYNAQSFSVTIGGATPPKPKPLVNLTSVQDRTKKGKVTEILLTFSGPVNAALADALATYRLATPNKRGSYKGAGAVTIKLKSAVYNATNDMVALTPRTPFSLAKPVQLVVDGVPPSGLRDTNGSYIDGADNDQAGSNAVVILSRRGATIDAVDSARASSPAPASAVEVDALLDSGALSKRHGN
jgi:hypothetical protein